MSLEQRLKGADEAAALEASGDRPERVLDLVTQSIEVMNESPGDFELPGLGVVWWTMIRKNLDRTVQDIEHVMSTDLRSQI